MSQVTRQKVDMKKEKVEEKFANAKQKMHLIHGEKKEKINEIKEHIRDKEKQTKRVFDEQDKDL